MIILITIDVEGAHSTNPVDGFIYGRHGNEEFGIGKIMKICDSFGIKGSFFVDVYEYSLHGASVMEEVVKRIADRQHDVQLHTHPAWPIDGRDCPEVQEWKINNCLYDFKRPWMFQYDFPEQIAILKWGKETLEKWMNKKIVAHRAGGYGVNKTSLKAAKQIGLKMDFSAFRGHSNCRLRSKANVTQQINGILEVPVTGFYRPGFRKFPKLPFRRRFIKTDIDWAFLKELKFFYVDGEKNGLNLMVLFMHSYSFLKLSPRFDYFEPDYREILRFENFTRWALEKGAAFMTVEEFWEVYKNNPDPFSNRDYIPTFTEMQ